MTWGVPYSVFFQISHGMTCPSRGASKRCDFNKIEFSKNKISGMQYCTKPLFVKSTLLNFFSFSVYSVYKEKCIAKQCN